MRRSVRRREYERINEMLDLALSGEFEESDYDESELSKLEVKWRRYLASSVLSARKINEERERIKELVTDISHQSRTPLANIRLYGQLLREQPLDETSAEMVDEILTYSKKLEFLIQSLVKTSRLESGVFQLAPSACGLYELAQRVCAAGEERAGERDVKIRMAGPREAEREKTVEAKKPAGRGESRSVMMRCDADGQAAGRGESRSVMVRCDSKWTQEALGNILDNAIKYSPRGGEICVRVFSYEMFAGIEIADHGMGIPEEEIPHIFARFYRGAKVHDREGVGVGLYLARNIIEGQGGYIRVISKVGEGSRFQVYLPR